MEGESVLSKGGSRRKWGEPVVAPLPSGWKRIRRAILKRDEHTCQAEDCAEPDPNELHVHHIDKDRTNNDPSNLLTLCRECHTNLHLAERKGFA